MEMLSEHTLEGWLEGYILSGRHGLITEGLKYMSKELAAVAKALVAPGKGLLAMDESNRACNKRFEDVGIA
jgi:hypothetical protein